MLTKKDLSKIKVSDDAKNKICKRGVVFLCALLFVCVIFKLFGANLFMLYLQDGRFKDFLELINSSVIAFNMVAFLFYIASGLLILTTFKSGKYYMLTCFMFLSISFALVEFSLIISAIVELLITLLVPIFFGVKWYKQLLLILVMYYIIPLILIFIKSVGGWVIPEDTVIGVIFMLDYLLIIVLLRMYAKRRFS